MKVKYINQLIQFGYWSYDVLFFNENEEIVNRFNTMFYSEPTEQEFKDRVNQYNNVMELNYLITEIQLPI